MKSELNTDSLIDSIGKNRAVANMILDEFEDMLDEKGISIPDEFRCGDPSEARIYGRTYSELRDRIEELLNDYYA